MQLAVLAAFTGGAAKQNEDGRLPLHLAVLVSEKDRQIGEYAARNPDAEKLHATCPAEVTLALLEAHRGGAKVEDAKGMLPLHYAIENENTPTEVTLAILEANEDAARFSNRNGEFPLHLAAKYATPVEITMAILAANPDAARAHTSISPLYLPLHIAVKQRSTENLLALLRAYPEGVKDRVKITDVANSYSMYDATFSPENVTPLLLAAREPSQATPEMFAALCWAYPEALLQKDEEGNVPNGFCTQKQEHGLRRMAHNIIWDYGALVEFHLCMFSARRTAGHPLCKFGSDSFAPHHRQIESFLLPCHGESKLFSSHLSMCAAASWSFACFPFPYRLVITIALHNCTACHGRTYSCTSA